MADDCELVLRRLKFGRMHTQRVRRRKLESAISDEDGHDGEDEHSVANTDALLKVDSMPEPCSVNIVKFCIITLLLLGWALHHNCFRGSTTAPY